MHVLLGVNVQISIPGKVLKYILLYNYIVAVTMLTGASVHQI